MPLMRYKKVSLWESYSASANEYTDYVDTEKVHYIGVYIESSGATDIIIYADIDTGIAEFDRITFTEPYKKFAIIWCWPFKRVRFKTTQARQLTIRAYLKT